PDGSLRAVTAFRYVERLQSTDLAHFIDLAAAALHPGGVLLIEPPHPDNAGTAAIHLDPFGRNPVHPEFLRILTAASGFARTEVTTADRDNGGISRYTIRAWR